MTLTAIVGATTIDGTGRSPLDDSVLLVEDGRLRSVTPTAQAVIPERAHVIDAAGKFIIPGLMDANVHLFIPAPDFLFDYQGRYAELVEEAAQITLKAGVTTVFDTWGPLEPLRTTRDRINRGETTGSRMFIAGNIVGFGGPFSSDFSPPGNLFGPDTVERINRQWEQGVGADLLWLTPEDVRRRVREYIERSGIDFVKYASSAHLLYQLIAFSEPAQRAIVEEAHRAGLTVQAHSTSVESLRMEIDAGADLLQHGDITGPEPMPEQTLRMIADGGLPVAALLTTDRHLAWTREHAVPIWQLTHNDVKDQNERRLIEAGARLLLTTDGFILAPRHRNHPRWASFAGSIDHPTVLGESHFLWLEAAIERGMTPMEALLSATRHIAEAYGQDAELGTLEPGKRADLVILDADPLTDVRNYRRIAAVVKDGLVVDRDALPTRTILTGAGDEETP